MGLLQNGFPQLRTFAEVYFYSDEATIVGKYGYHTCDYQTYLKVKELSGLYWKLKTAIARRWRWERKTVYRGAMFYQQRNPTTGYVVGHSIRQNVIKQPLDVCLNVCAKVPAKNGRGWKFWTEYDWIPSMVIACRTPQPSPVPVMSKQAVRMIDNAIESLKKVLKEKE